MKQKSKAVKKVSKKKAVKTTKVVKAAAKKKAPAKTVKSGSKLKIVNIKLSSKDRALLMARANTHTQGNLSAWLRHAGLSYVPKKSVVSSLKPYGK